VQQVDTLIRGALGRKDGAARIFLETNTHFNAAAEQPSAIVTTNQSVNSSSEWAKAFSQPPNPVT